MKALSSGVHLSIEKGDPVPRIVDLDGGSLLVMFTAERPGFHDVVLSGDPDLIHRWLKAATEAVADHLDTRKSPPEHIADMRAAIGCTQVKAEVEAVVL